jgi:hypothetical protein
MFLIKIFLLCLLSDKALSFGRGYSDKNTLFYYRYGKRRGKITSDVRENDIIIVHAHFCRYSLVNVDEGLLLKLHNTLEQTAQFNMRVSQIV